MGSAPAREVYESKNLGSVSYTLFLCEPGAWDLGSAPVHSVYKSKNLGSVSYTISKPSLRAYDNAANLIPDSDALVLNHLPQVSVCPDGTEAASLNIAKAYRNSPIIPGHKRYLGVMWHQSIYVQHVAIEGLATAGGIQGNVADACVALLNWHGIKLVVKWVDDFVFFCTPVIASPGHPVSLPHMYPYDLNRILALTTLLGIPWHPISHKGQDFALTFSYVGFNWDLAMRTVTIPDEKRFRVIEKLSLFIRNSPAKVKKRDVASIQGTIQHLTFVCRTSRLYLPPLSSFLAKFLNKYVSHHIPRPVLASLSWWLEVLRKPPICHSLFPLPTLAKDIWVDVLSSWGIGLVVDDGWAAWRLVSNWNSDGRWRSTSTLPEGNAKEDTWKCAAGICC